jgi:hypothetical protein
MPFLFPGEENESFSSSMTLGGVKPKGRRKFNKNGEEVSACA